MCFPSRHATRRQSSREVVPVLLGLNRVEAPGHDTESFPGKENVGEQSVPSNFPVRGATGGSADAHDLEDAFAPLEQKRGHIARDDVLPSPLIEPLEEELQDNTAGARRAVLLVRCIDPGGM